MSDRNSYDLRAKYTRFRILVIGRANAGKTTLLQRVCNTTEDPCIYDKNNKNLVSVRRPDSPEDEFCFWYFLLAWAYLSGTPLTTDFY
jgi:AAA+ ATPase superfamily predicted ATPase